MLSDYVTIPVHRQTRELIKTLGRKGETYDELIRRILSMVEYKEIMETHYQRLKEKSDFLPLEDV